jgi:hypothetical protein
MYFGKHDNDLELLLIPLWQNDNNLIYFEN